MTQPTPDNPTPNTGDQTDPFVPVASDAEIQAQADELLMHGLLSVVHERADGAASKRADRVMEELRAASGNPIGVHAAKRASRWAGRRLNRLVGVPAAVLVLLVGSWFIAEWPSNQAKAALMASATAVSAPGTRRYEVRLLRESDTTLPTRPDAIFDSDGSNFLLRARNPMGAIAIAGQDAAGEWAIRREGGIERNDPRRAWPRWSTDRGESLFIESVGALMKSLAMDYRLKDDGVTTIGTKRVRHITALRRNGTPPHLADRVELAIDVDSQLLERLEMNWDRAAPGARANADAQPGVSNPNNEPADAKSPPDANVPPDAKSPDAAQVPEHPDDRDPPRRGPDDRQPGMHEPDRRDEGPGGRLDGPMRPRRPGGPEGQLDRRPEGPLGERPEHPQGERPLPGMRRPDGPMGPRQGGPMGPGPRGPGMGPGMPGMGQGPGPIVGKVIRQLVIQRVDAPTWPTDWFLPESHLKGEWGEPESR